ncbi:MAG: hypothetical protein HYU67_08135 [Flavobacteriia bacterium]|nr:hypothetical protein [Flavobacteriia bacterium]
MEIKLFSLYSPSKKNKMYQLYIDPGTGSLLLQMLLGAVAAVVLFYKRIVYFFLKIFNKKKLEEKLKDGNED